MKILFGSDAAAAEGGGGAASTAARRPELRALRRLLLIAGSLLYLAYALITPPFQTPDEHQHLFRAWQLAHFQLHGERRGNEAGGMLPASLAAAAVPELGTVAPHASRPVPKRPLASMFTRRTPVFDAQPKRFVNFLGGVLYSPAGYLPQIAAVHTGLALGWSVENIVRLGRLFNAALALGLFTLALTIMPVGRLFVLLLALMPMTAAVAASLGQDGLILGSCSVLTALGVRAWTEGRWTRSSLFLLALFAAIVGLSKIVYLPLVGIAFFPLPRTARPLSWLGWPAAVGIAGAMLSAWWLHSNAGVVVRMAADTSLPSDQLAFVAAHPFNFVATLARTFVYRSLPVFLSTFTFGWVSVGPVLGAAVLAIGSLWLGLRQGDEKADALTRGWRRWAALLCLVVAVGIAIAMYLASSPLAAPVVEGLQGRYFLPLLPLVFLIGLRPPRTASGDARRLAILLMLGSNAAALAAIGGAFYSL